MAYVFPPCPRRGLSVLETDGEFPVNQIFCVGRNYADHAVEMGHDPDREEPFFFMKPANAILPAGEPLKYPPLSSDVHHEVELVVALAEGGQDVPVAQAAGLIFGYAVGIDLTRRDLQAVAKTQGRPWEAAKAFHASAPCSPIRADNKLLEAAEISLSINGEIRQSGNINQLIWKIPEIISRLSEQFLLQSGDLVFTGTPAGVGPIQVGDHIVAEVAGVGRLELDVVA